MVRLGIMLFGLLTLLLGGAIALARIHNPAGSWIAYVSRNEPPNTNFDIVIIDPNGREIDRLESIAAGPAPITSWSPTGDWLQIEAYIDGYMSTVWIYARSREQAGSINSYPMPPDVTWSPNGTRLAYTTAIGNTDPYALIVTVVDPAVVGRSVALDTRPLGSIRNSAGYSYSPVWSPDGTWIAYAQDGQDDNLPCIYRIRPDGSDKQASGGYGWCTHLAWSPDGQWIYFIALDQLWRTDFDTQTRTQVFPDLPGQENFALSPKKDGSLWILTITRDEPDTGTLYFGRTDETGLKKLAENVLPDRVPLWSPDGQWIAFVQPDERLRTVDVHTGSIYQIDDRETNGQYSWSPDSEWIAYSIVFDPPKDDTAIYLSRSDGTGQQLLANNSSHEDMNPAWSPVTDYRFRAPTVLAVGALMSVCGAAWPRIRRMVAAR